MMPAAKLDPSWPVSVALHALLLAVIVLLPRPQPFRVPADEAVPVELVTPTPEPVQLQRQPEAPVTPLAPATTVTPRPEAPAAQRPAMVTAHSFYAAKLLADPRSRRARQALATFAPDERTIQLCNIEAMEQIHRWRAELRPDLVVPYATSNLRIDGGSIHAEGGAFRASGRWYGVTFSCDVAEGTVSAFAFSVGEAIPEARWAEYNLVTGTPED
ncbi:uncharacterized protein DUF930 [Aminobacter aminovorans]|uniref:Domain of Uncharacterized Function (DUF930) n=1 Tax=Aminobacter aminovorans TaxID=83263 RepID=A0A380WJ88_AMIAI|nr:DUF930 domain-containing protein [Aminobacter aminovorans]TCS29180.1 uncharacterized protein DUF930 [Aminobacter aminovorans]SUU89033.1 Domain of Uncharacterised Function (DUF930) [Aminobacter aminovorans]